VGSQLKDSMRTINTKIDFGSLTGRSGVNLDEYGHINNDRSLIFWVIDGVSPLIFSQKHAWKFRRFFHAGKLLNNAFKCSSWNNVQCTFSEISNQIRESKDSASFLSGFFYHWPLFSCGLVKVDKSKRTIELALYGDCVIVVRKGDSFEKYEYMALENRKTKINKLFNIFDFYLSTSISGCLKKILFSVIRVQQIWFGKSRVFSIKKHYPPSLIRVLSTNSIDNIAILSDGVSWYVKNSDQHLRKLMNSLSENGVCKTLDWLRSIENENTDFGKYDDATIISISL
jgi:hypothetical protein